MQTVVPHFHHYRDLPLARHRRGDAPDDQKQPVYESNGNEILEGSSENSSENTVAALETMIEETE